MTTSSATLNQVSTLPTALFPISPSLSALQVARLRLLTNLPGSHSPSIGCELDSTCCRSCGALVIPGWTSEVSVGRGRRGLSEEMDAEEGVSAVGNKKKKGGRRGEKKKKVVKRKKKMGRVLIKCLLCEANQTIQGSDPEILATFKPARTVAKTTPSISTRSTRSTPAPAPSTETTDSEQSPQSLSPTKKPIPSSILSPLSSPQLSHVPISDPGLPSTPPPPQPQAQQQQTLSVSGGSNRKKKGKSSGLAKMLAVNREREEAAGKKNGSGLLDWM